MSRIFAEREKLPHFVYRQYDSTGALLYVGVTINPTQRYRNHSYQSPWFEEIVTCRMVGPFVGSDAGTRARSYERLAIFHERPKHNRAHHPDVWRAA